MAKINKIHQIAKVCHEATRVYLESEGEPQKPWDKLNDTQKASVTNDVFFWLENFNAAPERQHQDWMTEKVKDGWKYGETKDYEAKTHPFILPYEALPDTQKKKDKLIHAIINALK